MASALSTLSAYIPTDRKEACDAASLYLVNQLLKTKKPRWGWKEDDGGIVAPASTPVEENGIIEEENRLVPLLRNMDIHDDIDQAPPALEGWDRARWALDVMSGNSDRTREDLSLNLAIPVEEWGLKGDSVIPGMVGHMTTEAAYKPMSQGVRLNRGVGRRPLQRPLSQESQSVVDNWFEKTGIILGDAADSPEHQDQARRLAYTWKDCFALSLDEIKTTDLVSHTVELLPNVLPYRLRQPPYSREQRRFALKFFPELERAGWVWPAIGPWAAYAKFPPKADTFRVVFDYRPVNSATLLPQWPCHNQTHVFEDILQSGHGVFFQGDAAHGYHGVMMTPGDEYKAAVITPHAQYFTNRMPQGMAGASHTYSALGDVVFGPWPVVPGCEGPELPSIVGHLPHLHASFNKFIDDHAASAKSFDDLFAFLHLHYFPRLEFGRISLKPSKTVLFARKITVLGFELGNGAVRPMHKHRERFRRWAQPENHPKTRDELDTFLWLLPYLREFIPGRVSLTQILKTSYADRVPKTTPTGKPSRQMCWRDRDDFVWNQEHADAFADICYKVQNVVNAAPNEDGQFHLSADTSDLATGAVLFQLADLPVGTEMTDKMIKNMRVVAFMSFQLSDAETRYTIGERETLGVIKALQESRDHILPSRFPTIVYTDHLNMLSTLSIEGKPTGRIASWLDAVATFNLRLVHRPNTARVMQMADGLSRLRGGMVDPLPFDASDTEMMVPACLGRVSMRQRKRVQALPMRPPHIASLMAPGITTDMAYASSEWYGQIILYLLGGDEFLKDLPEPVRRHVKKKSINYKLMDGALKFQEGPGVYSACVLKEEVPAALKYAHDHHGHFSTASTLHNLKGEMWWPSRYSDVEHYIEGCIMCQSQSSKNPIRVGPIPVVSLRPWDLVGTDYSGKITPTGVDGSTHFHVLIDYFGGFIISSACTQPTAMGTISLWEPVSNLLGFPEQVYSDNASYFRDDRVRRFFESHGTKSLFGPVYHPASMGKAEFAVKMVKRGLKQWARDRLYERLDLWPMALPNITASVNNRLTRKSQYTPAEVMLGWPVKREPRPSDANAERKRQEMSTLVEEQTLDNDALIFAQREKTESMRSEHVERLLDAAVERMPDRRSETFQVGELVWEKVPATRDLKIRNFRDGRPKDPHDGKRARAFQPKWTGPWKVIDLASDVTVYIADPVFEGRKRRKVHINSLKPYRVKPPALEAPQMAWNPEEEERTVRTGSREDEVLDEAEPTDLRPYIVNPPRRI